MSPRESAVLMGFPSSWRLPKGSRVGQRAVGNALCIAMSKAIVHAALSICMGVQIPVAQLHEPLPVPAPKKRAHAAAADASTTSVDGVLVSASAAGSVRRRGSIEALVRELLRDDDDDDDGGEAPTPPRTA